jgi:hypothetical protein
MMGKISLNVNPWNVPHYVTVASKEDKDREISVAVTDLTQNELDEQVKQWLIDCYARTDLISPRVVFASSANPEELT